MDQRSFQSVWGPIVVRVQVQHVQVPVPPLYRQVRTLHSARTYVHVFVITALSGTFLAHVLPRDISFLQLCRIKVCLLTF